MGEWPEDRSVGRHEPLAEIRARASGAGEVYGAMDLPWAKLVAQIAHAYGKQ